MWFIFCTTTVSANGVTQFLLMRAAIALSVYKTAVFGSNTSNTVAATTNTLFAGTYNTWWVQIELYCNLLPHAVTTCCSCGTHYSTSVESKSLVVMWINTLPTPEKIHLGTDCATAMVLGTLHQERGADNMCWLDWLHLLCTSGSSQWWRYWTIQYTTHALWRHSRMVSVHIPFVWHKLVFIYVIII